MTVAVASDKPLHDTHRVAGVPLAIHPTFEPQWTKGTRMGT